MNATIIYYSSNKEHPQFEQNVVDNLLKVCGDLPIISVTQKPMNLGKNICVGDVGVSGFNMFRQVQIACKEATTEYVISAEADCFYPPDYFTFQPTRNDVCFRDVNLYVMPDKRAFFFHKWQYAEFDGGATHAQIVGREYYLSRLDRLFKGAPDWCPGEKNFPKERWKKEDVVDEVVFYKTENPVVQVKTHRSMRYYTNSDRTPVYDLPYWGNGVEFRKKYYAA